MPSLLLPKKPFSSSSARSTSLETAALAGIPDAIIGVSRAGLLTMLNAAAEALFSAYSSEDIGKPWTSLFQFASQQGDQSLEPVLLAASGSEMGVYYLSLVREQREILALISAGTLPDSSAEPGAVLVIRDVTVLDRSRREFFRSRHIDSMQQLVAGLATHCTNLTTAIQGSVEALLKPPSHSGERQPCSLDNLQKALETATTITRQLMAFSRGLPTDPRAMDLNRVVNTLLPLMEHSSGPTRRLVMELNPKLYRMEADPSHIEEIVLALFRSACAATLEGGTIRITTRNQDFTAEQALQFVDVAPGSYAILEMFDSGPDCGQWAGGDIFEPFFDKRPNGNGLDLAMVYGLTKQSGGHIWHESTARVGTRFSLCWPKADLGLGLCSAKAELHGSESILVVEPDAGAREVVRRGLLTNGYHILEAGSASEALRMCQHWDGDIKLMLMNVLTNSLPGPELARRLLDLRPRAKVLFMSRYSARILQEAGAKISGKFIQKPFSADSLARSVRQVLDS